VDNRSLDGGRMLRKYINLFKLIRKPGLREFWEYTKLIFIGLTLLGTIGFVIWIVFGLFIVR